MEIINKIKDWSSALADVGVSLIALGIVLEVLFSNVSIRRSNLFLCFCNTTRFVDWFFMGVKLEEKSSTTICFLEINGYSEPSTF